MLTIGHWGHHVATEPSTMMNNTSNTSYEIQCELHILTTLVIPDILLLLSFAYGLYIFRWKQTEQLSTLTETVGHPSLYSLSGMRLQCSLLFPSCVLRIECSFIVPMDYSWLCHSSSLQFPCVYSGYCSNGSVVIECPTCSRLRVTSHTSIETSTSCMLSVFLAMNRFSVVV